MLNKIKKILGIETSTKVEETREFLELFVPVRDEEWLENLSEILRTSEDLNITYEKRNPWYECN